MKKKSKAAEENLKKGAFTFDDYLMQIRQMKKMGGMEGVLISFTRSWESKRANAKCKC